jgi:hypothetical protein
MPVKPRPLGSQELPCYFLIPMEITMEERRECGTYPTHSKGRTERERLIPNQSQMHIVERS